MRLAPRTAGAFSFQDVDRPFCIALSHGEALGLFLGRPARSRWRHPQDFERPPVKLSVRMMLTLPQSQRHLHAV